MNTKSDGLEYYVEIAKHHYTAMERIVNEISVFQIDEDKAWAANDLIFHFDIGMRERLQSSQLSGWWRQIFSSYYKLNRSLVEALGYLEIKDKFEDEAKQLGMVHNFEYHFENYLFRLFALLERIGQLANIYYDLNIALHDVNADKICKKLTKAKPPWDDFTSAWDQHYLNSPAFNEMRIWRNHLTHKYELAIGHDGYPCAHPSKDPNKPGITYGGYEGSLEPDTVKQKAIESFNEITTLLKKLDIVIMKKCDELSKVENKSS